VKAAKELL